MLFPLNLGLFRAFFGRKIWCEKLGKSKANPLPKYQFFVKNGYFYNFFTHEKRLKIV